MTLNGCVSPEPSIYFPPPPASSGNVNGVGKQRDYFGNGYGDGELQAQGQGRSGGEVAGASAGEPNYSPPPAVPKAWK
jgi:hypothetical protein